jgi:hypothetical protein
LDIADKDAKYRASRFVRCSSKKSNSSAIEGHFCSGMGLSLMRYAGYGHDRSRASVQFKDFELALSYHGVKQLYTAVESHRSLGANERAYAVLRRVFPKTRHDHPKISQELALAYSQKAINETIGTDGIGPALLMYGSIPRFPAAGLDARLQPNSEIFRCMATARAEYARIVNHQLIQRLLRTRVPPAAERRIHVGQHVFV